MSGAVIAAGISGAISLGEYINTTMKMYNQKTFTEAQLLAIIKTAVQNVDAANLVWERIRIAQKKGEYKNGSGINSGSR